MKRYKFSKSFYVVVAVVVPLVLAFIQDSHHHVTLRIQSTNLMFVRRSIRLYAEQNNRFPDSLDQLAQYGEKFRDEIAWYAHPKDLITDNSTEHSVLDGTGGLYYDPNNGDLKLNLTRPLKSYWIFYFEKKRNDVPANW